VKSTKEYTSPSSWTETVAGLHGEDCPVSQGIAPELPLCGARLSTHLI
jgi:hypothetical protein